MDRNTEKLNWCLKVKTHKRVLVWDFLGWDIYGLWLLLLLSTYACVKYPLLKLFELLRIILIVEDTIPAFLSSFNTQHRFFKILNICMRCSPACGSVCLSSPAALLNHLVFGLSFAFENKRLYQLVKCLFTPPSGVGSFQNKSHFSAWGLNLCIR